jgi:hypothetical protein
MDVLRTGSDDSFFSPPRSNIMANERKRESSHDYFFLLAKNQHFLLVYLI